MSRQQVCIQQRGWSIRHALPSKGLLSTARRPTLSRSRGLQPTRGFQENQEERPQQPAQPLAAPREAASKGLGFLEVLMVSVTAATTAWYLGTHLASKEDLAELKADLRSDLAELKAELKSDRAEFRARFDRVEGILLEQRRQ